jgi:hypothetical protein
MLGLLLVQCAAVERPDRGHHKSRVGAQDAGVLGLT